MYSSTQKQAILAKINIDATNALIWGECKGCDNDNVVISKNILLNQIKNTLTYKEYILLLQVYLEKELSKIPHVTNSDGICDIDIIIDAMTLREHNGQGFRTNPNVR